MRFPERCAERTRMRLRRAGGGMRMTYDRLVCANCAAPVAEGRCRVCRASRERMQDQGPFAGLNPAMLIALMVILVAALALLAHQAV